MIHGTTSIYTQVSLPQDRHTKSFFSPLDKRMSPIALTVRQQKNIKRMPKNGQELIPRNVFLPVIRNCTHGSAMSLSFPSNANGCGGGGLLLHFSTTESVSWNNYYNFSCPPSLLEPLHVVAVPRNTCLPSYPLLGFGNVRNEQ